MIGALVVSAFMTAAATLAVPDSAPRRSKGTLLVSFLACVVGLRVASATGFLRWTHDLASRVGGEFDEASTWLVALGAALAVVVVARAIQISVARRNRAAR